MFKVGDVVKQFGPKRFSGIDPGKEYRVYAVGPSGANIRLRDDNDNLHSFPACCFGGIRNAEPPVQKTWYLIYPDCAKHAIARFATLLDAMEEIKLKDKGDVWHIVTYIEVSHQEFKVVTEKKVVPA